MSTGIASSRSPTRANGIVRLKPSQLVVLGVVWLAAMTIGYKAYQRVSIQAAVVPRGQIVTAERGTISASVNTTGAIVAGTAAKLTFKSAGRLTDVRVKLGDVVQPGQVLARLDQTDLQLQVVQSRAQLAAAEAKLAQMQQGSRVVEISAAETNLASARAKLAELQSGSTDAEVQAAQAGVANATSGLAAAQAKLADLGAQPKPEDVRAAQLQLEKAKNSLWSTQISRDGTCGNKRNAEYQCQAANAQVAAGETEVSNATANLNKASQPAKPGDLQAAQAAVTGAQSALDSAQAKLQQVKSGSTTAEMAAASAAVDMAVSQLALKRAPYTDVDLQAQRATIDQSKAALGLAENNLSNSTLVAPFAGTVASITLNVGEIVGNNAAVTLVDPKDLRIDTTVDESDIAKLDVGQQADISFDALPGKRFAGKVMAISPSGTVQSGVVTYVVSLSLEQREGLKAGMTANANIVHSRKDNVVVVPNRAIRAQGRDRVVEVVSDGGNRIRSVRVGASNDQSTEIVDGLAEGEQVLISSTAPTTPRVGGMPQGGIPAPAPGGAMIIRR